MEEFLDIKLIQTDTIANANDFYNRSHARARSIGQWKWEFQPDTYPFSGTPYVVVTDNGAAIGTQAMLPIRMIDRDGLFWTAKSEETLLDPAYRGKQLFEKMYHLLFEYSKKNDIHSIWGFTSATKAFKRLGFQTPGKTSQLFFPFGGKAAYHLLPHLQSHPQPQRQSGLKTRSYCFGVFLAAKIAALRNSMSGSGQIDIINKQKFKILTLENPPDQAGEICKNFIKIWGGLTIYRDREYLDWRLFKNPYVKSIFRAAYLDNELIGWSALAMDDGGMGYFVDLFLAIDDDENNTIHSQVISALLKDGISCLRKMGAAGIRCWQVNNHPFDKLVTKTARRIGFYHMKKGHEVVCFIDPDSSRKNSIASFDNWYITRIYTEGISG
jgi:hypothetical protein